MYGISNMAIDIDSYHHSKYVKYLNKICITWYDQI